MVRGRVSLMAGFGIKTGGLALALTVLASPHVWAAEHITLANGFDLICDHRVVDGNRVRLYTDRENFVEVNAAEIVLSEHVDLPATAAETRLDAASATPAPSKLTEAEIHELLAKPGETHHLDVDLLASVVKQESGGQVRAVSRTGARGLMQLMPGTAAQLGVGDSFAPSENVSGGTAYLDSLLKRYHDNLPLALAAYNAGPGAVERWRGVPPYRETRAYVARVIREFNRRVAARATLASLVAEAR